MNILPHLEIYADDVKCSHGATVGQLDAEALFYLRSRGISENKAKEMLLYAFAREIIDSISCISFRENILQLMEKKQKKQ
jgi:Fe-S cluster assembly protein SufD